MVVSFKLTSVDGEVVVGTDCIEHETDIKGVIWDDCCNVGDNRSRTLLLRDGKMSDFTVKGCDSHFNIHHVGQKLIQNVMH